MDGKPKRDHFRPLLIQALKGVKGGQDWRQSLKREQRSEDNIAKAQTSGPRGGITSQMLQNQLTKLKKVTEVNTPFAPNLSITRDGGHTVHTPTSFTDFVVNTRRDLTQLAQTGAGQDLFKAIGSNTTHKVRIQDAGPLAGIREAQQNDTAHGIRTPVNLGGHNLDWPSSGTGSVVSHHTDITERWGQPLQGLGRSAKEIEGGVGMSPALALGHELIHAARALTGWGAPEDPLSSVRPEERETVGTTDGKRTIQSIPTENELRRDLNNQVYSGGGIVKDIGKRKRYGGRDL